jgi:hypothetical protein
MPATAVFDRHKPTYEAFRCNCEASGIFSMKKAEWRFAKLKLVCYRHPRSNEPLFPGSSVVEQPAVNRLVAGSNPARGAKLFQEISWILVFLLPLPAHAGGSDDPDHRRAEHHVGAFG